MVGFSLPGKETGSIRIWNTDNGKEIKKWQIFNYYPHEVMFSPDGSRILTVGRDGKSFLWNVASGTEIISPLGQSIRHK